MKEMKKTARSGQMEKALKAFAETAEPLTIEELAAAGAKPDTDVEKAARDLEKAARRAYVRTKKDRKYGCLFNDDLQELKDLAAELAKMPDRPVEEIAVRVQALERQLRYINRLKYGKNLRTIAGEVATRAGYAVVSKTINR
ncbi:MULTISPECIES: hypothetical protein [Neisseria]|uniref:hypothetical protein n=1 Tax=Neisseria TaxID=482 RepID=UPI00265A9A7C|nr:MULTISPECIES: hypothetical protein [Neisseria]